MGLRNLTFAAPLNRRVRYAVALSQGGLIKRFEVEVDRGGWSWRFEGEGRLRVQVGVVREDREGVVRGGGAW